MSNVIWDTADKLSAVTDLTPINWDAFDEILKGLENINICDGDFEETILSAYILDGNLYKRGAVLAEAVRHFLSCGYDVSANDGLNGYLALEALCWSSFDGYILEAGKQLMNAGVSAECDDTDSLLECIGGKISGAWAVDRDYEYANALEAYYTMTEAFVAGKDYNSVDHYQACIGRPLTSVFAADLGQGPALHRDGDASVYSEPLVMWFEDKPLVVNCYTELTVNPIYANEKKDSLCDVTEELGSLVGATLEKVQYIDDITCYLEFCNGKRLFFSSRDTGKGKRVGTFGILSADKEPDVEQINVKYICALKGCSFADDSTKYSEKSIALFCDDGAYLLYLLPETDGRHRLGLCRCSEGMLDEHTRLYPLVRPGKAVWIYDEQNNLLAVRLDFSEGHLYIVANEHYEIEVCLSDELFDPTDWYPLPENKGKHINFLRRKTDI